MNLAEKFLKTIHAGLERKTLDRCSRWAEKCRIMGSPYPGPWTFDHHPWLRDMHDSLAEFIIGQKAAQMGYTEVALNITFYKMDIRQISALYILPAKTPDASDFSASRFDPALELSSYLQGLFSDVKNVGHKRAGSTSLYIRGSRSRAGLKSVPVGFLVFDELDEMTQANIPLAFERQSGQLEKQTFMISTPTITSVGINSYFNKSSQKEFFFPCPHCSRQTRFTFPDCIEIIGDDPDNRDIRNSYYKCKECQHRLEQESKHIMLQKGEWVPAYDNKEYDGFHINQMYSPTIQAWELAVSYLKSLTVAAYEQEFFNSKLGLPHIVAGARVTEEDILQCIGNHKNGTVSDRPNSIITMGIDVGRWIHYTITEYQIPAMKTPDLNMNARARILEINKVLNFEDIDVIIQKHRPRAIVCDSQPDRRKAYELAQRYWGYIWLCYYGNNVQGKMLTKTKDINGDELEQCLTIDRTSWLDLSLSRYKNMTIELPLDVPIEFKEHIKALVRKPEIDRFGNPTAKYVNIADDHYGHARNYDEVALPLAASIMGHTNIRSPL